MLGRVFISNILKNCKSLLSCCRGTPQDMLEAKLPDIISLSNYLFGESSIPLLISFTDSGLEVFSRETYNLRGILFFVQAKDNFSVLYSPIDRISVKICDINPNKSSKSIAYTLVATIPNF